MNDKDLLKKIKQEAQQVEPDLTHFFHERFGVATPKKKPSIWTLLPSATLVVGFFIMGILLGTFTPISFPSSSAIDSTTTSSQTSSLPPSSDVTLPPLRLQGDKDALSVSTITTATLFNNLNLTSTVPASPIQFSLGNGGRATYSLNETMTLVRPYLGLFEQLLGQTSAPIVTTENLVDQPFDYVDRFVAYDIQGLPIQYELFYDLINVETMNEELYYSLTGELVINQNAPLVVNGSKVLEENETILSFRAETDEQNYLESIYKYEENETKIRIRQMIQGVLQINVFKLEIDDDETEIELLFLEENDENRVRDRFKFEYEMEDDKNVLSILYSVSTDNGQVRGKIKVLVVEIFDQNNQLIGYEYLAYELDEQGNPTHEWRDDRDDHEDEDEDEDDEDDEDEDELND
jgi:hypothetical protein